MGKLAIGIARFKVLDFCDSAKFKKFLLCEMFFHKWNKVSFEQNQNFNQEIFDFKLTFPLYGIPLKTPHSQASLQCWAVHMTRTR